MATIGTLPNIEREMRDFVQTQRLFHKQISDLLNQKYPGIRGFSPMSVRRYCRSLGISKTSQLNDAQLDQAIVQSVAEVISMMS